MSLSVGIVGLPNAGKSTLFNALLKRQIAQVGEYPYTTIEPNVGVVEVPDARLDKITETIKGNPSTSLRTDKPKIVPAAIRFIDIAGLIKGAHKGEGLGNQFLAKIREVDAIIHVVREFENKAVEHAGGEIDPLDDIKSINEELKHGEIDKPTIYVLNVDEKSIGSTKSITSIKGLGQDAVLVAISAKLESELSELSADEQKQYLKELKVESSAIDKVIAESYKLLDLITFFTVVGGAQVQAWPVKGGTKMIEAARVVHSDFEKGFIAAEVVDWQKLVDAGSWKEAKDKGLVKTAGRDEIVSDGLVIEFKFNM